MTNTTSLFRCIKSTMTKGETNMANGIQKQIDSTKGQLVLVFALDDSDPMRVRKYIVDKSL